MDTFRRIKTSTELSRSESRPQEEEALRNDQVLRNEGRPRGRNQNLKMHLEEESGRQDQASLLKRAKGSSE